MIFVISATWKRTHKADNQGLDHHSIKDMERGGGHYLCWFRIIFVDEILMRYLGRFKKHLPLVHGDLVGAGLWSSKENDVFVWEGLQRFGLTSLVHGHVFSAHTQPQIMREASFFAL